MKKAIKIILGIVLALVALIVILIAALPLYVGPVVRPAVNVIAPTLLKVDFNLGKLAVNPYTGRIELGDLRIGNPEGYSETNAVTLGKFVLDIDYGACMTNCIAIEELTVDDIYVSYVSKDGTNNIDAIVANLVGGVEEAQAKEDAENPPTPEEFAEREALMEYLKSLKLRIGEMGVRGISAKVGLFPLVAPKVEMTGLGGDEGLSYNELWALVLQALMKEVGMFGGDALKLGGDGLKLTTDGGKAVIDLGDKGGEIVIEGADKAVDSVKDAAKALKGLFK